MSIDFYDPERDDVRAITTMLHRAYAPVMHGPEWYHRADVGIFAQLAVDPEHQRCGLGARLIEAVASRASRDGKCELACDTAEPAIGLRAYYSRLGFREVASYRWPHATYSSVVLSKPIA